MYTDTNLRAYLVWHKLNQIGFAHLMNSDRLKNPEPKYSLSLNILSISVIIVKYSLRSIKHVAKMNVSRH
jgi:hypothetical protein